jgi:hypothetical protein
VLCSSSVTGEAASFKHLAGSVLCAFLNSTRFTFSSSSLPRLTSDGDSAAVSSLLTEANEYVSNRLKGKEKKIQARVFV